VLNHSTLPTSTPSFQSPLHLTSTAPTATTLPASISILAATRASINGSMTYYLASSPGHQSMHNSGERLGVRLQDCKTTCKPPQKGKIHPESRNSRALAEQPRVFTTDLTPDACWRQHVCILRNLDARQLRTSVSRCARAVQPSRLVVQGNTALKVPAP
jgi:hypothetical protein